MTYVDVGGRRTWHEVVGDGDVVVLLHGGFAGADSWGSQTPVLAAAGYQVYVPERRGHAHTPDVDGPITYAVMAEDTIAYLDEVVGPRAHLIGWSDGAVVALLVAQKRPDLVNRMVLIGQYYNSSGRTPDGLLDYFLANREQAMAFLRTDYDQVSPDGPQHFPVVFEKMLEMFKTEPEIDLTELATVTTPTLVLQGDRDDVLVAHSMAAVEVMPNARLAVLPGSHLLPIESPDLVNPVVLAFLAGDPPVPPWETML
jgi:pimeloyl-ACP methyl ester carboxylesterase